MKSQALKPTNKTLAQAISKCTKAKNSSDRKISYMYSFNNAMTRFRNREKK
jgi:hypothetical protein